MKLKKLFLALSLVLLASASELPAMYDDYNDYEIYSTAKTNPNPNKALIASAPAEYLSESSDSSPSL